MSDVAVLSAVYVVLFIVFWVLQIRTRLMSTRYYLQIGSLFILGGLGLYLAARLLAEQPGTGAIIFSVVLLCLSLYHLGLFIGKATIESDGKYRRYKRANRAIVSYDFPHQRFNIKTEDGITLQAISITDESRPREKAIIVCHGAGRNKNNIPIVQTVCLLATKYDVYTFDFRGHMESGGVFTGDGDIEFDLKAMIDYLEQRGYQKIAVFGWSIGAWTALLSASRGRHINAIIAGAPPPVNLAQLSLSRTLQRFSLIQIPILAGVVVVRNFWTTTIKSALNIEDFVRHISDKVPILFIYNDYDTTIKLSADAFERLYDKLPAFKEKMRLPGKGHLFDWPNTYFLWNKMFDWLEQNF